MQCQNYSQIANFSRISIVLLFNDLAKFRRLSLTASHIANNVFLLRKLRNNHTTSHYAKRLSKLRIITTGRLTQFISTYPDSETWVKAWKKITKAAKWQHYMDVRNSYPSADPVEGFTVFDVNHNKYRLITKIEYRYQMVFIKHFLTHAEYTKGDWKK